MIENSRQPNVLTIHPSFFIIRADLMFLCCSFGYSDGSICQQDARRNSCREHLGNSKNLTFILVCGYFCASVYLKTLAKETYIDISFSGL